MNNQFITTTQKTREQTMKRGSIPGIFGESDDFDKDNLVSYGKQTKNVFHLWLIDEIGDARQFLKWYDILQNATEDDLVVIHVNCYGGNLFTAIQIITQIKTCQAQVVCQIESACCSAATMIALACDGMLCYPHGYMMIHTSSGISIGKQSDIKKEEEFYNPWLENFFNEIYKHFLTKKEIQSVLGGEDMWLTADQVTDRFKKRVDIINRENARAKREHMKKIQSFMSNLQNAAPTTLDPAPGAISEQPSEEEDSEKGGKNSKSKKKKQTTKRKTKKPAKKEEKAQ